MLQQHLVMSALGNAAGGGVTDPNFANVSLLLHGEGSNGSTTITDSSSLALAGTANGNAQVSTAQFQFGAASLAFDGTGDYISYAANAAFGFGTGDFTFELFLRLAALGADQALTDFRSASTGNDAGTFFIDGPTGKLAFWSGAKLGATGTALTTGAWNHVALTRASGTFRAFIAGVTQWTSTSAVNFGATRPLGIGGAVFSGSLGTSPLNGWIDELRITKGVARYTADFTPPAAAFPNS